MTNENDWATSVNEAASGAMNDVRARLRAAQENILTPEQDIRARVAQLAADMFRSNPTASDIVTLSAWIIGEKAPDREEFFARLNQSLGIYSLVDCGDLKDGDQIADDGDLLVGAPVFDAEDGEWVLTVQCPTRAPGDTFTTRRSADGKVRVFNR